MKSYEKWEDIEHFEARKEGVNSSHIIIYIIGIIFFSFLIFWFQDSAVIQFASMFFIFCFIILILIDIQVYYSVNRFYFNSRGFSPPILRFPYIKGNNGFIDFNKIDKIIITKEEKKIHLFIYYQSRRISINDNLVENPLFNDFFFFIINQKELSSKTYHQEWDKNGKKIYPITNAKFLKEYYQEYRE